MPNLFRHLIIPRTYETLKQVQGDKLVITTQSRGEREDDEEHRMKFVSDGGCFVCGDKNPHGLKIKFQVDRQKQTIHTTFTVEPIYQGWDGVVHGGIVCTLLDEAMANLVYELGLNAIAASLEVRFKKPAPTLQPLRIDGEITEVHKKLVKAKASVAREDGAVLATATASFVRQGLEGTYSD